MMKYKLSYLLLYNHQHYILLCIVYCLNNNIVVHYFHHYHLFRIPCLNNNIHPLFFWKMVYHQGIYLNILMEHLDSFHFQQYNYKVLDIFYNIYNLILNIFLDHYQNHTAFYNKEYKYFLLHLLYYLKIYILNLNHNHLHNIYIPKNQNH